MLTDPNEIEIISAAIQPGLRHAHGLRGAVEAIIDEFLNTITFQGARLLDLGPGQFDFCELARQRGAIVHAIDKDPAVVKLGNYKRIPTVHGDLRKLNARTFEFQFDGVFCKFSINALWYRDSMFSRRRHRRFIGQISRLIKPGGWAWIAPWNGTKIPVREADKQQILGLQAATFKKMGFWAVALSDDASRHYGVCGDTFNRPLFCFNLPRPAHLANCTEL